jgi:hypothetical protein
MNSTSSLNDEFMNRPLVTVIVVNFNSIKIKNIIRESLRAIFNLKYSARRKDYLLFYNSP